MAKKKASGRGRPKGSRNKPVEGKVVVIPPRCPHCDSPEIKAVRGSRPTRIDYAYTHPVHGAITSTEKQRMICDACGRVFMKETHQLAELNNA